MEQLNTAATYHESGINFLRQNVEQQTKDFWNEMLKYFARGVR